MSKTGGPRQKRRTGKKKEKVCEDDAGEIDRRKRGPKPCPKNVNARMTQRYEKKKDQKKKRFREEKLRRKAERGANKGRRKSIYREIKEV